MGNTGWLGIGLGLVHHYYVHHVFITTRLTKMFITNLKITRYICKWSNAWRIDWLFNNSWRFGWGIFTMSSVVKSVENNIKVMFSLWFLTELLIHVCHYVSLKNCCASVCDYILLNHHFDTYSTRSYET